VDSKGGSGGEESNCIKEAVIAEQPASPCHPLRCKSALEGVALMSHMTIAEAAEASVPN